MEGSRTAVTVMVMMVAMALTVHAEEAHHSHRPSPADASTMARWLVSSNAWGVVSTVSIHLNGIPFGNVASYSDGPVGNSTGVPYFYLSALDPTPKDVAVIPYASLTISEAPLGTCGIKDVENPTCAKITLSGQMYSVDENTEESDFATLALFSKHPEMKGWPKHHNFKFYGLKIQAIFLIDWYGGAKAMSVDEYLGINYHSLM
eukprot:c11013_g1_i1 orf=160-771(+)